MTPKNSLYFTDAFTVYAAGESGKIWKTVNAGSNWTTLSTGISNALHSIFFPDEMTGYAVGHSGIILKSNNAGITWDVLNSGTQQLLTSVFFTDVNTGYVAGWQGTLLKTNDGGLTWVQKINGYYNIFSSLYFPNPDIGYLNSSGGLIFRTLDAGETWTPLEHSTNLDASSLYFTDVDHGVAVGGNMIIKTVNGSIQSVDGGNDLGKDFSIYPNPANEKIIISPRVNVSGQVVVCLLDFTGKEIIKERYDDNQKIEIPIEYLAGGIYFVKIQCGDHFVVNKLIKP